MSHQISLFSNAGNLNLIYVDQNGLHAFTQNSLGVWAVATAPGPNPVNVTFTSVLGLSNVLFALDQNGKLWRITQDASGNWSSAGFQALPSAVDTYIDFSVTAVEGIGALICGATIASPFVQFGPLDGTLSQPVQLASVYGPSIAVAATHKNGTTTAVMLGATASIEINRTSGAYSTDGVNWQSAVIPQTVGYPDVVAIATGNAGTLQAIILSRNLQNNSGIPCLLWDSSGNGSNWSWYGPLPNSNGITFTQAAAANGNGGNLQVVGIGATDGLPYLIWQDASNGNWMGCYQLPIGQNAPKVIDLCMGTGNQGYLQVAYIGADGKIYVNWQDQNGKWGWYGPLP